jgi:hypothetical protein
MPQKHPPTERRGGPGSSKDDVTKPRPAPAERPDFRATRHSQVSGGGGEADIHHDHDPKHKRAFQAGKTEKREH